MKTLYHNGQFVPRTSEDDTFEALLVADDGIGISPQDLGPLLRQINGEGPIQGRSFALRNIHEQLCIAYGPRDIHIESRPGAGTRVFFRIPLERREPHV